MRTAMPKPQLDADQHLAMLNQELRKHEHFQEGMAFLPYPDGTRGRAMTGYSVTGPVNLMGIYAKVASSVATQFHLRA